MTAPVSSPADAPLRRRRVRWDRFVFLIACLGAAGFVGWRRLQPPPPPAGVSSKDYAEAARTFQAAYRHKANRSDILSLLGEQAVARDRFDAAMACFQEIPSDHALYGLSARLQEAQILLNQNRARASEAKLRECLENRGRFVRATPLLVRDAFKRLIFLLSVEMRFEDRKVVLRDLHAAGLADVYDSKQLYFPHLLLWHTNTGHRPLTRFVEADPDDVELRTALCRYQIYDGQLQMALDWLRAQHQQVPGNLTVAAALLEAHYELAEWEDIASTLSSLPPSSATEPWLLTRMRAEAAVHHRRWEEGRELFERMREFDPGNPWSQTGLVKAYAALNRKEDSERAQLRSRILSQIRVALSNVNEKDPEPVRKLAADCDLIDFHEAAETFREHASRIERTLNISSGRPATP